jgi:hypothetical protein
MPVSYVKIAMKIPILTAHPGISHPQNSRRQRKLKQKDVPVIVANVRKTIVIHRRGTMARSISISQAKSMIRQLQNQQRQAVYRYNQAVRDYNHKVNQAITRYNQEVDRINRNH